ncbi:MAG: DUF1599 domain-containing protein [Bacteroides sp.]|nr:DUF1599 domain-containing protein [Bacteroides sp.]MCM1413442.1 DUF1599 domain-containing protein [Bacteroides sp.]MCM1471347.1 DUF1599 domain-containing protein [Bacteroides sp.]
MDKTQRQFDAALKLCRDLFEKKLHDYGASWRIMRPCSITDQIFIKAKRIRTLQQGEKAMVDEGILPEFIAIVNYGIVGVIQLTKGFVDTVDMDNKEAMKLYDHYAKADRDLMLKKNHDYGEAWRDMRVSSYVDFILTKIQRTKQIEDNDGATQVSEGIDANYMDMVNYALFGIIKLTDGKE